MSSDRKPNTLAPFPQGPKAIEPMPYYANREQRRKEAAVFKRKNNKLRLKLGIRAARVKALL